MPATCGADARRRSASIRRNRLRLAKGMPVAIRASSSSRRRRDAQPLVLQPGAAALLGPEALVGDRLVDQRRRSPRPSRCRRAWAPARRSRSRSAGCRGGSCWCRRADRRSSAAWPAAPSIAPPSSVRKPQSGRAARSSSHSVRSAAWSALETKSAGPLRLTCRCSTSPKSRRRRWPGLAGGLLHHADQPDSAINHSPCGIVSGAASLAGSDSLGGTVRGAQALSALPT